MNPFIESVSDWPPLHITGVYVIYLSESMQQSAQTVPWEMEFEDQCVCVPFFLLFFFYVSLLRPSTELE